MDIKRCTKCKEEKPLLEFSKDKRSTTGFGSRCKECVYIHSRQWALANKDRVRQYWKQYQSKNATALREYSRSWYFNKKYGAGQELYEKLLSEQNAACAICGGPPNGKGDVFHVDHDHATGSVRALLCHGCNTGIGSLREDTTILRKAIEYLEKHKCKQA